MLKTRGRTGWYRPDLSISCGDARSLQRLRRAVVHLGPLRDEIQHDAFGFSAVGGAKDIDPVRFQRGSGSPHAGVLRRGRESTQWPVEVGLNFAS